MSVSPITFSYSSMEHISWLMAGTKQMQKQRKAEKSEKEERGRGEEERERKERKPS